MGVVLVVICGAGASYGCILDRTITPPLTKTLFDGNWSGYLEEYGAAAPLIGPIRRKVDAGGDIEEILDSYQQVAEHDSTTSRQLGAITFYIRDVVHTTAYRTHKATAGVNFYAELVNHLRQWQEQTGEPLGYVTFNYDDLLDRAWSNVFGQDVRTVDALVGVPAAAPVFHPHGSVHWCRPILNPEVLEGRAVDPESVFRKLGILSLGDVTFDYCQPSQVPHPNGKFALPALALPLRSKSEFVFPVQHLELMSQMLAEATRVLVIGWQANEHHFLQLWHQQFLSVWQNANPNPAKALLVNSNPEHCSEASARLASAVPLEPVGSLTRGFESLIDSGELAELLS
jgi:hypothetical protein